MKRTDTWMPLYIGDYLADTGHLSTVEHGAYMLLLMHYWRTGPLPDDDEQIGYIVRMDAPDWLRIAKKIRAFFSPSRGRLHQKRIDVEIARAQRISEKRAQSGAIGGRKASENREHNQGDTSNCLPNAKQTDQQNDRPSPSHVPSKKESKEDSRSFAPKPQHQAAAPIGAEFDEWWRNYPRRVGKGAAEVAYLKARKIASAGELIAALDRKWATDEKYIPHPATWLNKKQWLDEIEPYWDPCLKAAGLDRDGHMLAKTQTTPQLWLVNNE